MASKMFGAMAANCLRSAIHPMPSAKSSMVVGGTARGMIQDSGLWQFLAVASSPFAVGLVWNKIVIAAETGSAEGETTENNVKISTVPSFYHTWKAMLPMFMTTMTMTTRATLCEANDRSLDADTEAEIEAALKSRITPREEMKRSKFLQNQSSSNQKFLRKRMTNVGRFSLVSETSQNPSVPVLVMAMTGRPYFADDFRRLYRKRKVAEKHPRFGARLDDTKTHFIFDIDDGSNSYENKDRDFSSSDNVRDTVYPAIPIAEVKDRINDAALYQPLDLTTKLWEAWIATGGAIGQSGLIPVDNTTDNSRSATRGNEKDVESLLLFRSHHCMADGVSMAVLFSDLMDEGDEIQANITSQIEIYKKKKRGTPWWKKLLFVLYYWIWGSMKALMYQAYLFLVSWYDQFEHDDPWIILKTLYDEKRQAMEDGRQQIVPPRSLSWETIANVDDVKKVAKFYSKANMKQTGQKSKVTINDIFCSCVSAAIVKQLEYHRAINPKLSSTGQRLSLPSMNLIIPVHLQGGILLPGQSMGNKIGAMVSRIPGEYVPTKNAKTDNRAQLAQERLIKVHSVLNARKQTPIAVLSYLMAGLMGYISPSSSNDASTNPTGYSVGSSPSSWTPWIFRKAHANASVVVTNVRGPETEVHIEGRSVRSFLGFLPLPAGVPIGIVVSSYGNKMTLTVTAEEYAVPDADLFLKWVRNEYELLKRRADEAEGTQQ